MFDAESTTDDVIAGVRLDGTHAVITGATGGLGLETARALAVAGADVTITGRRPDAVDRALATLRDAAPDAKVRSVDLDLASLASVTKAATWLGDGAPIDILVNNAGIMMCPLMHTADGFEMQTGTNHLGHFAFTMQIAHRLSPGARVVTVSSRAHHRGNVDLTDLNWKRREYDKFAAYGQSKTANIWFASELQRRAGDRLLSLSVHPGAIITDLGRHLSEEDIKAQTSARAYTFKSIPQGAATSVWAATAPELSAHGGRYLADCRLVPVEPEQPGEGCAPWAYDADGAVELWRQSVELTSTDLPNTW